MRVWRGTPQPCTRNLRLFGRVPALVLREAVRPRERLAAARHLAHVRLFARVRALVHREVARLRERLSAARHLAHVRLFARVRALVHRDARLPDSANAFPQPAIALLLQSAVVQHLRLRTAPGSVVTKLMPRPSALWLSAAHPHALGRLASSSS